MSAPGTPHGGELHESEVARSNAERLLGVYAPPSPDPAFVSALRARLREVVVERAAGAAPATPAPAPTLAPTLAAGQAPIPPAPPRARGPLLVGLLIAALAGAWVGRATAPAASPAPLAPAPAPAPAPAQGPQESPSAPAGEEASVAAPGSAQAPPAEAPPEAPPASPEAPPEPAEAPATEALATGAPATGEPAVEAPAGPVVEVAARPVIAPRTAPAPAPEVAAIGSALETGPLERRRVQLPDGSRLWIDGGSRLVVQAARRVSLERGEVLVDVAPRPADDPFVLVTPRGEATALGTRFDARVSGGEARILVTHGRVAFSGWQGPPLTAGQWLSLPAMGPPARGRSLRPVEELSWARELAAEADPPSRALDGPRLEVEGQALELRRTAVDVHIQDGFARTALDLTWFNPSGSQQEGTLHLPLPPDAAISRLAMYVNGQLLEGAMLERERARDVYETIRHARRDPALLEWLDGNTFKLRVFPLEARQEKRVVITWLQRLAPRDGRASYRLPGPLLAAGQAWSFRAHLPAHGAWRSPTHALTATSSPREVLVAAEGIAAPARDLVLELGGPSGPGFEVELSEDGLDRFLFLRWRPELPAPADGPRPRRDWVVLFEAAGDRDPALAGVQLEVVRGLLSRAEPGDSVQALLAGTRPRPLSHALPATPANVEALLEALSRAHLVGALDLGAALSALGPRLDALPDPVLVHVGGGMAALGERDPARLAGLLPVRARYLGVAVGRRWSRSFMELAAARSGGLVAQLHPGEPARWRGSALPDELLPPRLHGLRLAAGETELLPVEATVGAGEELIAVGRLPARAPLPAGLEVEATLHGQPWRARLPVREAPPAPALAARLWARLRIERLVREGRSAGGRAEIVDLSTRWHVLSPITSLLVLESEADYARHGVAQGPPEPWAPYGCPARIPVVTEQELRPGASRDPWRVLETVVGLSLPRRDAGIPFFGGGMLGGRIEHVLNGGPPRSVSDPLVEFPSREAWLATRRRNTAIEEAGGTRDFQRTGIEFADAEQRTGRAEAGGASGGVLSFRDDTTSRSSQGFPAPQLGLVPDMNGNLAEPRPPTNSIRLRALERLDEDDFFYRRQDLPLEEQTFDEFEREAGRAAKLQTPPPESEGSDFQGLRLERAGPLAGFERFGFGPSEIGSPPAKSKTQDRGFGRQIPRFSVDLEQQELLDAVTPQRPAAKPPSPSAAAPERQPVDLTDPLAFAPGLRLGLDDVRAVLELETDLGRQGRIDPLARELVARAGRGWQRVAVPAPGGEVLVDWSGEAFRYQRTLPGGLIEQVLCDAGWLHVVYPELGVGGSRTWSRAYRGWLEGWVPWAPLPARELARGADVLLVEALTVAVVPFDPSRPTEELRFAPEGRLAERRWRARDGALLGRETYSPQGEVVTCDGEGKELARRSLGVQAVSSPPRAALRPDAALVMLPLPARTDWPSASEQQLRRLAWNWASGEPVVMRYLLARDRRVGLFAFLAGGPPGGAARPDPRADHPQSPLAAFLGDAWFRRTSFPEGVLPGVPAESFLGRLQRLQRLAVQVRAFTPAEGGLAGLDRRGLLGELAEHLPVAPPAGALEVLAQLRGAPGDDPALVRRAAALFDPLLEDAQLGEQARRLQVQLLAAHPATRADARQRLLTRYEAALAQGRRVPLAREHTPLLRDEEGARAWVAWVEAQLPRLLERGQVGLALDLAEVSRDLGQVGLEDRVWSAVLAAVEPAERAGLLVRRASLLAGLQRTAEAEALLQGALSEELLDPRPWTLAAELAEGRDDRASALRLRERAAELTLRAARDGAALGALSELALDLLERYRRLAEALRELGQRPPADLAGRVTRAADLWRAVDPDPASACAVAAEVLTALGEDELAWDYLVTPLATTQGQAAPWAALAGQLAADPGRLAAADLAWAEACAAEPTNAGYFEQRALLLEQRGLRDQADAVWRRIATGTWQPRFAAQVARAKQRVQTR